MSRMNFSKGCRVRNARFGHDFAVAAFRAKPVFRRISRQNLWQKRALCVKDVSRPFLYRRTAQCEPCVSQKVRRQLLAETPLKRLHVQRNVGRTSSKVSRNGSFAFLPDRVDSTCMDINAGSAYRVQGNGPSPKRSAKQARTQQQRLPAPSCLSHNHDRYAKVHMRAKAYADVQWMNKPTTSLTPPPHVAWTVVAYVAPCLR